MISKQRFETVREQYGHYASWAVWGSDGKRPKDGMGDISFFDDPSDEFLATLDPMTILVALNISRAVERPFGNFHPDYPEAQDYKLRYALRGTGFWGSYMTDIIKDFEEKISGNMMSYLRQNPQFEQENIKIFREELAAIGSISPTLIALGGDSFRILKRTLGDEFPILKAPHYSMYISKEDYRVKFEQLGR